MKPMLAVDYSKLKSIKMPVIASPKIDGIRGPCVGGLALTRSLKEVPNRALRKRFGRPELDGLDGEYVIGAPTAHDAYRRTVSGVMSHAGEPEAVLWVFDYLSQPNLDYVDRLVYLDSKVQSLNRQDIKLLEHEVIQTESQLFEYEKHLLDVGYEGIIWRQPFSPYKFGRSSPTEQWLVKKKVFLDSEAVILDMVERLHNENPATTNELGYTQRSSHQEFMVGQGTLGALVVADIHSGIKFNIGTGFIDDERERIWNNRESLMGKVVKYKYFPVGVKDLPRHPVFLGFRSALDMS